MFPSIFFHNNAFFAETSKHDKENISSWLQIIVSFEKITKWNVGETGINSIASSIILKSKPEILEKLMRKSQDNGIVCQLDSRLSPSFLVKFPETMTAYHIYCFHSLTTFLNNSSSLLNIVLLAIKFLSMWSKITLFQIFLCV